MHEIWVQVLASYTSIRRHERNGEIKGHKKYNASKFVLNQKQERKWALELVR